MSKFYNDILYMESNMYKGKINIIAVGLHKDEALFIINNTEYITVHKKFILHISDMIQTPYAEKNEYKFQFFHVLDGVQERNCFISFKNCKFEITVDSITEEISDNLLQSFTLIGFLRRFIMIEEKRNAKPNILQAYNEDKAKQELLNQAAITQEVEEVEEEIIEIESDIRLQPEVGYLVVNDNVQNIRDLKKNPRIHNGTLFNKK